MQIDQDLELSTNNDSSDVLRHTVYRYYDREDRLLYVGISNDPEARRGQHRSAAWYGLWVRYTVEAFETREDASAAEREAIRTEHPLHNIAGTERATRRMQRPARRRNVMQARKELREAAKAVPVFIRRNGYPRRLSALPEIERPNGYPRKLRFTR